MGQRHKPGGARQSRADQAMRDQEVLRANRELAAYFRGRRTEREARAALKIIKAFIRDREVRDATNRPPLPRADAAKAHELEDRAAAKPGGEPRRRKPRRKSRARTSKGGTASIETQVNPESPELPDSDEPGPK